jgi:hypothetical protein
MHCIGGVPLVSCFGLWRTGWGKRKCGVIVHMHSEQDRKIGSLYIT